jgi:DNA-binding HxlR family transcriptional regulator
MDRGQREIDEVRSSRRTYGDPCGVARALDVIGERWALLVVRELLLGPKRFSDLRLGLPHVGPDMLSQRLRELEEAGVVQRDTLPSPSRWHVYELTERGRELEPVVLELGRWGSKAPFPSDHGALGIDALIVALKATFDPVRAGGLTGSYELRLGEQSFEVRVRDGRLDASRGPARHPDATIVADSRTFQQVLWHGRRIRDALRSGELTIAGDGLAGERFLRLFPLPA